MTMEDNDVNGILDGEDMKAIAALAASDVDAIDQAILSNVSSHWKKTALVIATAMYAYPERYNDIPDVFYGQRILALAEKGLLDAIGDPQQWRFSEVRLGNV